MSSEVLADSRVIRGDAEAARTVSSSLNLTKVIFSAVITPVSNMEGREGFPLADIPMMQGVAPDFAALSTSGIGKG